MASTSIDPASCKEKKCIFRRVNATKQHYNLNATVIIRMARVSAIQYYLAKAYSLSAHHITLLQLGFRQKFPKRSIITKHTVKIYQNRQTN